MAYFYLLLLMINNSNEFISIAFGFKLMQNVT